MKSIIIATVNENLGKAITLIDTLDSSVYCDGSIAPYYSSVGDHLRHVLDFFDCIVSGLDGNTIDLTSRKRDISLATDKEFCKSHIHELQKTLVSYLDINPNYLIHVTDMMGSDKVAVSYTLESILAHANSHTIHHFAMIGYLLSQLGVTLDIEGFGYNPSTPIQKREGI